VVRVHCTLKSNKTNSSNKNRVPTSNSEKTVDSPGTNDKLCDFPTYSKCDISITRDVIALQCDKCISVNSWKCVDCFDLPVAAYETLMSGCGSELKWFCKSCDDMITKQCDKTQEITQSLSTLIGKSENMESALLEKVDTSVITALESRVAKVEESAALKLLEEKVEKLTHSVHGDVTALHKSLKHKQMKTEEDKDEKREIDARKNNVIVQCP